MDPFSKRILAYCEAHTRPAGKLLAELERETHLKTLAPQMMSGHLQGAFLRMLSLLMRPRKILEVGTFTGYAALCMAEGLAPDGELHTIEANPELEYLIRKYVDRSPRQAQIHLHIGDALEVVPRLEGPFELVFVDAGKLDYPAYYDLILPKMPSGGLLLADNVLWSGKVLEEDPAEEDTQVLKAFNEMVRADPRVENLMLPLRDGLSLVRRL